MEIFVVGDRPLPPWLSTIARVFLLRHLLRAVLAATDPATTGAGFARTSWRSWRHGPRPALS